MFVAMARYERFLASVPVLSDLQKSELHVLAGLIDDLTFRAGELVPVDPRGATIVVTGDVVELDPCRLLTRTELRLLVLGRRQLATVRTAIPSLAQLLDRTDPPRVLGGMSTSVPDSTAAGRAPSRQAPRSRGAAPNSAGVVRTAGSRPSAVRPLGTSIGGAE